MADGMDELDEQVRCAMLCCAVLCCTGVLSALGCSCNAASQVPSMPSLCAPSCLLLDAQAATRLFVPLWHIPLTVSFPLSQPKQDLLLDALASWLITSGWRSHLLDTNWLRLARLAQQRCRQLAASSSTTGEAHRLRLSLKGAVRLYYGQQPSSRDAKEADRGGAASPNSPGGSSGGDGSGSASGGSVPAELLQLLDAALAASMRAYRPPCSASNLSHREAPPLDQQFRPVACRELPPLCRASDFSGLPPEVLGALDGAPGSQPLQEVRGTHYQPGASTGALPEACSRAAAVLFQLPASGSGLLCCSTLARCACPPLQPLGRACGSGCVAGTCLPPRCARSATACTVSGGLRLASALQHVDTAGCTACMAACCRQPSQSPTRHSHIAWQAAHAARLCRT